MLRHGLAACCADAGRMATMKRRMTAINAAETGRRCINPPCSWRAKRQRRRRILWGSMRRRAAARICERQLALVLPDVISSHPEVMKTVEGVLAACLSVDHSDVADGL